MKNFNLEESIKDWKKSLLNHPGMEPGYVEEIEGNLRDRLDDYIEIGHAEEDAFRLAKDKSMPNLEQLAKEYYKAHSKGLKPAPWERRPTLVSRLPLYLKTSVRNLYKRKIYSILNICGLAISISMSYLIWLYVQDQSSYDRHFEGADNIYRVIYDVTINGEKIPQADVGQPVGPTLKADFPEIIETTRIRRVGLVTQLSYEEKAFESEDVFVADEHFFDVFNIELSAGDKRLALSEPKSMVISEDLAMRLFGRTDVLGEVLQYSSVMPAMGMKITGVMTNLNKHTHIPYQALVSYGTYFYESDLANWLRKSYTYVVLNEVNNIDGLRAKIPDFNDKYLDQVFEKIGGEANLLFQPLTNIHLDKGYLGEPYPQGSRSNLQILTVVMIFLIIMAVINYVNLATAQSVDRALEVGIRKTLGSTRALLIFQFLIESVLLAFFSGLLAIFFCLIVLPEYAVITGLTIDWSLFLNSGHPIYILLLSLIIGLVSGFYPAVYLTSYEPKVILKGRLTSGRNGGLLRKALIVTQYTIASILIVGVLVVTAQTQFIKSKDVGFDKDQIIELSLPDDPLALQKVGVFMEQLRTLPHVRGVSVSEQDLSSFRGAGSQQMLSPDGERVRTTMSYLEVGSDFFNAIGAEVIDGRGFDEVMSNERTFVLNEAAVKAYGWQEAPLGVVWLNDYQQGEPVPWKAVGVIKDFSLGESYLENVPMMIYHVTSVSQRSKLFIGLEGDITKETIQEIESLWDEQFSSYPLSFEYVKDKLGRLYKGEELFLNLISGMGLIIVFITVIGIIGLISFTTEQRKKEIALRKICGATIASILLLLSRQFAGLLIFATSIALPIGYYLSQEWLSSFPLRIELTLWQVLMAIPICAIFTAMALVYHVLKAAKENPVYAMRYE